MTTSKVYSPSLTSSSIFSLILFLCSLPFSLIAYAQSDDAQTPPQNKPQAVILLYHHISSNTPPSTSTSIEDFRLHLAYLKENNFSVMPLEVVIKSLQDNETLPNKVAVISFDDGYLSIYENAFPILREYQWPFSVFISTSQVSDQSSTYMNWQQINELSMAGATIANHSVDHTHLVERLFDESNIEWQQRIIQNISDAEIEILKHTGQNHQLLAYPYGEYNLALQAILKNLGFVGLGQHSGAINAQSDFSALPRFSFSGIYAAMSSFPTKVNSLVFNIDEITPESPVTSSLSPSITFKLVNHEEPLQSLNCFNNNQEIQVELINSELSIYQINTTIANNDRRFRFNCTSPSYNSNNERYYWHTFPWFNFDIKDFETSTN